MSVLAINTYTQTITPSVAKVWLEFKYSKQRTVDARSVAILAEAMRRGRFTTNTMKFAMYRDGRFLVNGQHTLTAIVSSGVTLVLPVQDFVVDSEDDIARLYYHEDTNRRRSFQDSVRAMDFTERLNLSQTQIKQTAAALKWVKSNFGVDRKMYDYITQDDLLEWVPVYTWEIEAIYDAISPCLKEERNIVIKQSILAVGLITMRYVPDKARVFWGQVAKDNGLERYDARKTLRSWLIANTTRRFSSQQRIDAHTVSRVVALAWNAWCDGRSLRYMLVRDTTKPLELRYCGPFNGNQSPNYLPLSESPNKPRAEVVASQAADAAGFGMTQAQVSAAG